MKRFVAGSILSLLVSSGTCAVCAEAKAPLVERQDISVTLVPEKHLLVGESTITLIAGTGRATFTLSPAATIDRVTVAGKDVPFSFAGGRLAVNIPAREMDALVPVMIGYRATFNDHVPERPVNSEDPTYGVTGAITRQGVFLGSGAGWYPVSPDNPRRRTIRIAAPAGTEAVTAGKRVARETAQGVSSSTWVETRPGGDLSLSAGPYQIGEKRVGGLDIYTYFYPDNAGLSTRYLEAAAHYIRFYEGLFGPYPFEKFAVVENFFPTGFGFPSYTLLGSQIIRLPFIIDTSLPHEIAHCWWGNGVLADYRDGNWSEGLVTYLADYLLKEKKSPVEGRDYRNQILSDYAALVPPDRDFALRNFTGRVDPASRAIGYGKGAMLFHMVRSVVGDQAFYRALQEIFREKLFKSATWNDFISAFSRNAGKDLAPFMEQWLDRPGGPHFALVDVTRRREVGKWLVSGVIVQTPPFYAVSLPLRLDLAGSPIRHELAVTRERTPFSFSTPAPPRMLLLDPDAEVFRILAAADLPLTVNRIKGSEKLMVVITRNCRARHETLRLLLESLGQGDATVVAEDGIDATRFRTHDILFCGTPQRQGMLPPLPEGVDLDSHEFTLEGEKFSSPDGLLFMVMRHPVAEGRIAALFLPLSEGAAERSELKITHYGKFSYLVFVGGENRRKGLFPPAQGSNVVDFRKESGP